MDISIPGIQSVPKTGVIYVMQRAYDEGYDLKNADWVYFDKDVCKKCMNH